MGGLDMRKAFIDPDTRILTAHGFISSNEPSDLVIDVPDDFGLEPGKWRHDGSNWVEDDGWRWSEYRRQALVALSATDITVARISEAVALGHTTWNAPDVVAVMNHRRDLRAILSQPQPDVIPAELPAHPGFPAGT
jgi:hypothetical protein